MAIVTALSRRTRSLLTASLPTLPLIGVDSLANAKRFLGSNSTEFKALKMAIDLQNKFGRLR